MQAWVFLLPFLIFSCAERHFSAHQFPYHDNGIAKPKIAIVPVITHDSPTTPWNLSEELTDLVSGYFLETKNFFLTSDFSVLGKHLQDLSEINPLIEDIRWLYENGSSSEFVVFIELVEHTLLQKPSKIPPQPYSLHMGLRVHVIDIRGEVPKIILQELVCDSFHISLKLDYSKDSIGKTAFFLSPLGSAHMQMIKRVSEKIQDYILLARV